MQYTGCLLAVNYAGWAKTTELLLCFDVMTNDFLPEILVFWEPIVPH